MDFDDEERTAQQQKASMRRLSAFITKYPTSSGKSFEEPSSGSESESSVEQVPLPKKVSGNIRHKQVSIHSPIMTSHKKRLFTSSPLRRTSKFMLANYVARVVRKQKLLRKRSYNQCTSNLA
jgi:hypothetical protein